MNTPTTLSTEQLASATKELAKLPILGPAMWLLARDAQRRYTFVADIDWRFLPPIVLDQCRLFTKAELPWAFATWAFVSDAVHERLKTAAPVIAPHEWKSGPHAWLVDVVAPFGDQLSTAQDVAKSIAPGQTVNAWLPDAQGQLAVRELKG